MNASSRRRGDHADQALIRLLFERYGHALLAYSIRLTGNRSAAEEIVQETMLRAWRHAGELSSSTGPRRWLITVARNLAIDRARACAARPLEVAGVAYLGPVQADHADPVVDAMDMYRALRSLPVKHRQVLIELYYKDRTASEAAEHLGIPVGTVRSRAYHALRSMRAYLDRPSLAERTERVERTQRVQPAKRPEPVVAVEAADALGAVVAADASLLPCG